MGVFEEEENGELGRCRKHPWRNSYGVCAICLRNRLLLLCPDCANTRPCSCCNSENSSSSSSFSLSSSCSAVDFFKTGDGAVTTGRMSFLIENEPPFRRSRSSAVTFLRTKPLESDLKIGTPGRSAQNGKNNRHRWFFWPIFHSDKRKNKDEEKNVIRLERSKSVNMSFHSDLKEKLKGRRWYFPSPSKIFRQQKIVERSPLRRG